MNRLLDIMHHMLSDKYAAIGIKPEDKLEDMFEEKLSQIELLTLIEFSLGVYIPNEELKKIKTIGDLYARVYNTTCASQ